MTKSVFIEDLDSANGTFVNGEDLLNPIHWKMEIV